MANITAQNNIRYCIDTLDTQTTGVVASRSNLTVNLSRASRVTGITVGGSQPAGTTRHFAFNLAGIWGRLTSSGTFEAFETNSSTFAVISANGNTSADLTSLTDIPALAGQTFGIAIALSSTNTSAAVPTASLSFSCVADTQQTTTTEYSPVYELGQNAQLLTYALSDSSSNGGNVSVTAQIRREDNTLSSWLNPAALRGVKAQSLQFRADYSVPEIGTSKAQLNSASYVYAVGGSVMPGSTVCELITRTIDWYMPIHHCRLTVYHDEVISSEINCFVSFRDTTGQVRHETLGVGTGSAKTYQLAHASGVKYDTFTLYYDGVKSFADYSLDCEVGRVTCTAPSGTVVSCDYDYGSDVEVWEEMAAKSRVLMGNEYCTVYELTTSANSKTGAALKLQLLQNTGHINNEVLGAGTGQAKTYKLTHIVKDGQITVSANNAQLPSQNWRILEDPQYISIAAGLGTTVRAEDLEVHCRVQPVRR